MDLNAVDSGRREFNSLVALAVSGLVTGAVAAVSETQAGDQPPPPPTEAELKNRKKPQPARPQPAEVQPAQAAPAETPAAAPAEKPDGRKKKRDDTNPLLQEPHVCRGLNTCRGRGRDGKNACLGQGVCATAGDHECNGHNECRGLGACDRGEWPQYQPDYPGENTCEGKGACQVPMYPQKMRMWQKARNRFVALMLEAGKKVGNPPR